MRKMKIIPDGVRHALNEAVHIPKSRMKGWLKNKCDALHADDALHFRQRLLPYWQGRCGEIQD